MEMYCIICKKISAFIKTSMQNKLMLLSNYTVCGKKKSELL